MFTASKAVHRSLMDHFLLQTAVSDACGGADTLVLDNIVHYADPHMRTTILSNRIYIATTPYFKLKSWRNSHSRPKLTPMRRTYGMMW